MKKRNYLDFTLSKTVPYMRDIFIDEVYYAAKKNRDIFFTTPDMGAPSLDKFREELPKQFIHSGICEQHMIAMAAGLTLMKKKVFCYAMAPFITSRCYEQIKCSVAAMDQPVCLVGIGVGLGYADAGPTHYTTEDIATMRVFPNIEIITPSDVISMTVIIKDILKKPRFIFLRLDKDIMSNIYLGKNKFNLKNGFSKLIKGKKKCIISSGFLLNKIYKKLNLKNNKNIGLIDLYKIKPLNNKFLKEIIEYDEIITIEEQWVDGGFGSAILEFLSKNGIKMKVTRHGLKEKYYFENGGREYLHNKYGLNINKILKSI